MITITPFEEFYTQDVIDLVLHFQNDGTRPIVTVEDQPDLLHITDAYFRIGGSFWIARDGEKLAGTIGIMPCGNGVAVLKIFSSMRNTRASRYIWDGSFMRYCCNLQKRTASIH